MRVDLHISGDLTVEVTPETQEAVVVERFPSGMIASVSKMHLRDVRDALYAEKRRRALHEGDEGEQN